MKFRWTIDELTHFGFGDVFLPAVFIGWLGMIEISSDECAVAALENDQSGLYFC
jgi:hypothetical protein